jgi:hypothetical protein
MFKVQSHKKSILSSTYVFYNFKLVDKLYGINPNEMEPQIM